jgi:endogenous inhibitor of DNA gyrase (YacG/DUF329 family)
MTETIENKVEYFQNLLSQVAGKPVVLQNMLEPEEDTNKIESEEVTTKKRSGPRAKHAKPFVKNGALWIPPENSVRIQEDGTYNDKPVDPDYFKKYYHENKATNPCPICAKPILDKTLARHQKSNKCMLINLKKELMARTAVAMFVQA